MGRLLVYLLIPGILIAPGLVYFIGDYILTVELRKDSYKSCLKDGYKDYECFRRVYCRSY